MRWFFRGDNTGTWELAAGHFGALEIVASVLVISIVVTITSFEIAVCKAISLFNAH
jgi:hypothetical protein